jgi:tetratricopeptide (TPR) repeat protein
MLADRDFREGRYRLAVNRFEEVIQLDPTFAPAHFKLMLARIFADRPSQFSAWLEEALDAISPHRQRLDPLSQQLLEGYRVLIKEGDIRQADSLAHDLVGRSPQAESLFLLGYVRFYFRAVLPNSSMGEAAHWFREAVARDARFAMSLWHLAIIGMVEDDGSAKEWLDRFLAVDSTSFWAEVALLADTALHRIGGIPNIPESLNAMSFEALELLSTTLGEMNLPATTRPVAEEALGVFRNRAETVHDRRLSFRMTMANRLAAGRYEGADSLMQEGARNQVPDDELARWIVLSAITPLHDLAYGLDKFAAVEQLETGDATTDPEVAWLLARWHLQQESDQAAIWRRRLSSIAGNAATTSPLARSLEMDILAVEALATGDSAQAIAHWDEATRYYSVTDDYIFGLTTSLWPLRLQYAEALHAQGLSERALGVTGTFKQLFGFVDQVVWPEILLLEIDAALAAGEPAQAIESFNLLDGLLIRDRESVAVRDLRERGRALLEATSR